eukprot:8309547-Pyramimonas_sp.AAC.1
MGAPAPLGPRPGVTLRPPWIDERCTRWVKEQSKADFYCQGCLRGPFKHDTAACVSKRVRLVIAVNRQT